MRSHSNIKLNKKHYKKRKTGRRCELKRIECDDRVIFTSVALCTHNSTDISIDIIEFMHIFFFHFPNEFSNGNAEETQHGVADRRGLGKSLSLVFHSYRIQNTQSLHRTANSVSTSITLHHIHVCVMCFQFCSRPNFSIE